ncbi:MAG: peptidoglycan-binding protein [Patescibacteria group bacterium]|nr:peptidoglycan-binding protein [Patescibacteria group bacterium]
MNKKLLVAAASLASALTFVPMADAAMFQRPLTIGSSGPDVRALQLLLNQSPATEVAPSGPGSSGQETDYFGPLTAAAVTRFQEEHAADILAPAGLSSGTGYVGALTLSALNALYGVAASAPSPSPSSAGAGMMPATSTSPAASSDAELSADAARGIIPGWAAFVPVSADDIALYDISHETVKPGDSLTLFGYGFDASTTVNFGPSHSVSASASSTRMVTVTVPWVPFGEYSVWASDSRGSTASGPARRVIIGTVSDARPSLLSVSPSIASSGGSVTVTASALDRSGNTIYSDLGIIRSVPSLDGRTLSFSVDQLPGAAAFFGNKAADSYVVTFSVGTQAGRSLDYGYFTLIK